MPTLVLNDTRLETQIGELILNAARREAMHIGFVCDGNGLCQTCECRILKGAEHLNPPNEVEQIWLTHQQLEEGRRLACQVSMRGPGPVEAMTRAEEFRRQTFALVSPPEGTNFGENLGRLISMLIQTNIEHVRRWPFNMFYSISNAASTQVTIAKARDVMNDTWRITRAMTGTAAQTSEKLLAAPEPRHESRSASSTPMSADRPSTPAAAAASTAAAVPAPASQPSPAVAAPAPASQPSPAAAAAPPASSPSPQKSSESGGASAPTTTSTAAPAPASQPSPAAAAAPPASSPSPQKSPQSGGAASKTAQDTPSKQQPQSGRKPPRSSRR